jgi:hypothetical protein
MNEGSLDKLEETARDLFASQWPNQPESHALGIKLRVVLALNFEVPGRGAVLKIYLDVRTSGNLTSDYTY